LTLDLAVLPFLPAGRGALILILGGLLVLPVSLLMSRVGLRPLSASLQSVQVAGTAGGGSGLGASTVVPAAFIDVTGQVPYHGAGAHAPARPMPPRVATGWSGSAMEHSLRQAVGGTQLVWAAPGHYVVRLGRCNSCARRLAGCEGERAAIERTMGQFLRSVRVLERTCGQRQRGGCTFEITGA
jgi:hypothetical protein